MAAGRIKGITIEIGGNATPLVQALAKVDNSITKTQSNLRDLNKALKLDPGNTELLKDRQMELGKAIEDTKSKLETEKQALEQMKNTEGFDANSQAARDLKVQIDLDTAALKELEAQAKQASSVLGSQMQAAGQKIQEVGEKIKGVGDKIAGIGQSLTTKVTVPIVSAFGASAKAAIDWETAFTGVQKTVDATSEEYDQLATNIKKMATETASSATDIAGVMEIAGQLGISGVENLTNFTKTMVELGDTTNLTAEEAATALARFMNITGESTSNVDKIGAAIVDLGNNFATSEAEIVAMSTRLASAGTIAGLTSTDILALATAMSSVGLEAEAGGTAMSQTLKTISKAVFSFREGEVDDLQVIADVAEMTANDFAKAWQEDPITAIQAFIEGLSVMTDAEENVFGILEDMGMTGIRQTNMIQSLALASNMLGDAVNTSSKAYKENSALTEEAAKRYGTMAAKISQLKARITEVAIEIGETLMPYIEKAMTYVEGLVEKWKALDDEQKEAILKFAAIAAAIGPVLLVVGKLIAGFGSIVTVVGKVVSGIGTLISSAGGLSGVFAALASPVTIIVAAIGTLAAGFLYLYNTNEQFRNSVQQTVASLQEKFAQALETIKPKLEALQQAFQTLMDAIAPVFEALFEVAVAIINGIIDAIGPLVDFITSTVDLITNLLQGFMALVQGDFDSFFEYAKGAFESFCNAIVAFLMSILNFVNGVLNSFGINLKQIFTVIWEAVKIVVKTKLENIKTEIETKWTAIKEWLTETLTAIKEKFVEIFDKIKEAVKERIDKVKETIVDGLEKAADYIKELPGKFFEWGADMVQNLIDGIQSKIDAVRAKMSELAAAVKGYIHFSEPDVGPLSDFHTYMPDMIDMMVRGINQGIPRLENAMSGLTGSMAAQLQTGAGTANTVANTNNININVYGAQGQDPNALADIIEARLSENILRRGAAFG